MKVTEPLRELIRDQAHDYTYDAEAKQVTVIRSLHHQQAVQAADYLKQVLPFGVGK